MARRKDQTEQSDQMDDDDSAEGDKIQIRKPKIDRIDKFKNLKKIAINVSMTQYPVVTEVADELGWKVQTSNDAGDWDVYWTDFSIDPDILIKMHLFQKINHFPGIHVIARKNLLGHNLTRMGKRFPNEYNFFPQTWMLPQQYAQFRQYYQSKQKGKTRTYIVKPEADCQGRGIFLTRRIEDMETGKHYVVQRYMARPFLLDGLKFDMRIYVLMCGTDPLKLYLYNQGLARLATQPYHQPMNANLDRLCMHLTNYAINKFNPNFIFNNNVNNMGIGHKRALSCVFKQLAQRGLDVDLLKQKIKDIIIKTVISGLPLMAHQYKFSQPQDYSGNMCFHILGLDVMINNKGQPVVIQVNHTPSFTTDTPLDHKIKFSLIKDTLLLMNINTKQKTQLFNRCKEYNSERLLTGKRHIYQGQDRQAKIKQAQLQRQKYQSKNLGGFQKIYPLDDPEKNRKYEQMIGAAMSMYMQQNQAVKARYQQKQMKKLLRSDLRNAKNNTKQTQIKNQKYEIVEQENKSMIQLHSSQKKIKQITENLSPRGDSLALSQPVPKIVQNQSNILTKAIERRKIVKIEDQLTSGTQNERTSKQKKLVNRDIAHTAQRKQKSVGQTKQGSNNVIRATSKRSTPSELRRSYKNSSEKQVQNAQAAVIDIFHGSQQSNIKRKIDKLSIAQNRIVLRSEPKPIKYLQSLQRKQLYDKKLFGNGNYVMPKIMALNVDPEKMDTKQKQAAYLLMGRKAQSTQYPNNG